MKRFFYGPGDWLATRYTARQRRAVAAWLLILSVFPFTPLTYFWKDAVWMVWVLSILAIWISLATIVTGETPVEKEDDK